MNTITLTQNFDAGFDWIPDDWKVSKDGKPDETLVRLIAPIATKTKLCRSSIIDWADFVNGTCMEEPIERKRVIEIVDKTLKWLKWDETIKDGFWIHWEHDKRMLRKSRAGLHSTLLPRMFALLGLEFRTNTRLDRAEVRYPQSDWLPLQTEQLNKIAEICNQRLLTGLGIGKVPDKQIKKEIQRKWRVEDVVSIHWTQTHIKTATDKLASETLVDPYAELVEAAGQQWDGLPRVDKMIESVFAVDDKDLWVARLASRNLMLGMVWRTLIPGTKHDECVVLIGDEDIGKSTFCREILLDGDYLREGFKWDATEKEMVEQCKGKVLVEASEMDGMSWKVDASVKTMLAARNSHLRMAYERYADTYKYQHIIIGTSNTAEILPHTHKAGNRRFIPVEVGSNGKFVTKHLTKKVVVQLWAEAYHRVVMNEEPAILNHKEKATMLGHLSRFTAPTRNDDIIFEYLEARAGTQVNSRQMAFEIGDRIQNLSQKALRQMVKNTGLVESQARSGRDINWWIKGTPPKAENVLPLHGADEYEPYTPPVTGETETGGGE